MKKIYTRLFSASNPISLAFILVFLRPRTNPISAKSNIAGCELKRRQPVYHTSNKLKYYVNKLKNPGTYENMHTMFKPVFKVC